MRATATYTQHTDSLSEAVKLIKLKTFQEKNPAASEEDKSETPAAPAAAATVVVEMDPQKRKELEEKIEREMTRFKNHMDRSYVFPDEPTVLVHPNRYQ